MTEVERIHNIDGARRWLALASACVPVDHPGLTANSLEEILHQLSGKQTSSGYAHFVAVDGDVDSAYGTARLSMRDNLESAFISLSVLPSQRCRGVGSALAQEILAFVRREGRAKVMWTVGSPLGESRQVAVFVRPRGEKSTLETARGA